MKRFVPYPGGNVFGALFDGDEFPRAAIFLTPQQAKFEASFKTVREAQR